MLVPGFLAPLGRELLDCFFFGASIIEISDIDATDRALVSFGKQCLADLWIYFFRMLGGAIARMNSHRSSSRRVFASRLVKVEPAGNQALIS